MSKFGATIENSLTRQGGKLDISSYFDINDLISAPYSPNQMRSVSAANSLCQKVVGFIPREMVNVQFSLSLTGQSAKSRSIQDLTMIQEQLRRLMSWMGEAQRKANIVGRSYLVFEVSSDDPRLDEDIVTPEESLEVTEENVDELEDYEPIVNDLAVDPKITPLGKERKFFDDGTERETSIEDLFERFPFTFPVNWTEGKHVQLMGVRIVDGDRYKWTKDGQYIYRSKNDSLRAEKGHNLKIEETLRKWIKKHPDGDSHQFEIIHRDHLVEFYAFDYQDDREEEADDRFDKQCKKGEGGVSYRLTRFVSTLLYYESFINATLNRVHRSEFISYQKEDLGETNLDIARAAANSAMAIPGGAPNVIDPELAVRQELQNVAHSALNLGIVLTDKKSALNMISRSFTGIQNIHDVFRPLIIGASHLTEFTLFGLTMASAGLNSHDIRDRMSIGSQVDQIFRDNWVPMLERLANNIALSYDSFPVDSYLTIKQSPSFTLTELEIADVLEKWINTRLELVRERVISREELRAELKGDGMLGKYFVITEPDKKTEKEIKINDDLYASVTESNAPPPVRKKVNAKVKVKPQVTETQEELENEDD